MGLEAGQEEGARQGAGGCGAQVGGLTPSSLDHRRALPGRLNPPTHRKENDLPDDALRKGLRNARTARQSCGLTPLVQNAAGSSEKHSVAPSATTERSLIHPFLDASTRR